MPPPKGWPLPASYIDPICEVIFYPGCTSVSMLLRTWEGKRYSHKCFPWPSDLKCGDTRCLQLVQVLDQKVAEHVLSWEAIR